MSEVNHVLDQLDWRGADAEFPLEPGRLGTRSDAFRRIALQSVCDIVILAGLAMVASTLIVRGGLSFVETAPGLRALQAFVATIGAWTLGAIATQNYSAHSGVRLFKRFVPTCFTLASTIAVVSAPVSLVAWAAVIGFAAAFSVPHLAWQYVFGVLFPAYNQLPCLVIGESDLSNDLNRFCRGYECGCVNPYRFQRLTGILQAEPGVSTSLVASLLGEEDVAKLAGKFSYAVVAESGGGALKPEFQRLILSLPSLGVPVLTDKQMFEHVMKAVPVDYLETKGDSYDWFLQRPTWAASRALSRAIDIAAGLFGSAITLCLIPFVALGQFVTGDRGGLFYTQKRVGEGGKLFDIIKFRTMIRDGEKGKAMWADKNDPRITKMGSLMRKTRIDEFPQFFNVLRGEMAVVGPRPERPELIPEIEKELPFYNLRHAIKPGITGWAQIHFRYGASVEDTLIKLRYDAYYMKHKSLLLDLFVIVRTPAVMLEKIGY